MERYYIICADIESAWRRVKFVFPTQTKTTKYCLNFTNKQFILVTRNETTSDLDPDCCYRCDNPTYYAYSEENMDKMTDWIRDKIKGINEEEKMIDWIKDKIKEIDEEGKKEAMKILGQTMTKLTFPTVMWIVPIKKVIFNNPATIVMWEDRTKTVVKAEGEDYDPEKGLAMAIAKKAFGNEGNYYNEFKKWLPKES